MVSASVRSPPGAPIPGAALWSNCQRALAHQGGHQFVNALEISGQVDRGRRGWTGDQVDSLLMDTLLIVGSLAILLAPMALALAIGETKPSGAGWKLLTFICCAVAAWFLFFAETSGLVIAFVAWLLAWACALVMRMSFNRRLA